MTELLDGHAPLSSWIAWVEGCTEQCLSMTAASDSIEAAGRSLVMRWSLFTSLLLRDLTLKGGQSFGSFHLLRLLLDEYAMFYVERRMDEAGRAAAAAAASAMAMDEARAVHSHSQHPGLRQDVLMTPSKRPRQDGFYGYTGQPADDYTSLVEHAHY